MRMSSARWARWRQPTQVLTGSILAPASSIDQSDLSELALPRCRLVFENAVWLNIDLRAGQLGCQTSVLTLFADRER